MTILCVYNREFFADLNYVSVVTEQYLVVHAANTFYALA